jgi:hypothetical protein
MVLGANPDQEFALQPIDQLLVLPCDAEWLIRPVLVHVSGKLAVPAALSAGRTTNSQAR